jgi:hypothetical protein
MGKRRTWRRWTRPAPSQAAPSGPPRWRRAAGGGRRRSRPTRSARRRGGRLDGEQVEREQVEREQVERAMISAHLAFGGDISSWVESHGITRHCPVWVRARRRGAWSGAWPTFSATFRLLGALPTSGRASCSISTTTSPRWTYCTQKRRQRPEDLEVASGPPFPLATSPEPRRKTAPTPPRNNGATASSPNPTGRGRPGELGRA